MTPSPTPTPTTDACFYRDAEFNGSTVHVLVDAFGRMLVMEDYGVYYGIAWNDSGLTSDFESDGDHAADFNAIRTAWGYNDSITELGEATITFTDEEGNSVLLTFDSENKEFVPNVGELTNGEETIFYRTLNDGTDDINCLCNSNGLLLVADGKFFTYSNEEVSEQSDATALAALTTAAGGSDEGQLVVSSDGNYSKITFDDYSIVYNMDGDITMGLLKAWSIIHYRRFQEGPNYYLVDDDGKVIVYNSETNASFYAEVQNYDDTAWMETTINESVVQAWGRRIVEMDNDKFTVDGIEVSWLGYGFEPTPTLFEE